MLAALTASQMLLGFPQSYWMISMIEVAYVLFLAISQRVYFPLLKVFIFKLLGVLMASVQLIPTLALISSTDRPIYNLAYQGEYSFHPINSCNPFRHTILMSRLCLFIVYGKAPCIPEISPWFYVFGC